MRALGKNGLPSGFKAWGGVLTRLLCPLLVYEVPRYTVKALE